MTNDEKHDADAALAGMGVAMGESAKLLDELAAALAACAAQNDQLREIIATKTETIRSLERAFCDANDAAAAGLAACAHLCERCRNEFMVVFENTLQVRKAARRSDDNSKN